MSDAVGIYGSEEIVIVLPQCPLRAFAPGKIAHKSLGEKTAANQSAAVLFSRVSS